MPDSLSISPGLAAHVAAGDTPELVATPERWRDALLDIGADEAAFEMLARRAFDFQVARSPVYRAFVGDAAHWSGWRQAPLLPIDAFRLAPVAAFDVAEAEAVFVSSGTTAQTGQSPARQHVRSLDLYRTLSAEVFRQTMGPGPYVFACHLPGYAERGAASSLVAMAQHLVARFGAPGSTFFLDDTARLAAALDAARLTGTPFLLLGAAFGLLDLAETGRWALSPTARVVETGGMKTRRREVPRAELHAALAAGFGLDVSRIGSEFGMAELTSQGWAVSGGRYVAPPWMRVRALDDPALDAGMLRDVDNGRPGRLAVVDLASVFACPFILTDDRAVVHPDGTFEVLGRMPNTSLRGCNFLIER